MRDPRQRIHSLTRGLGEKAPALFIGGLACDAEGSATIPVANPSNGALIGRTPAANAHDVERAVDAARQASPAWSELPAAERASLLLACADALAREATDLAAMEAMQTGKTFRDLLAFEVAETIALLRYYAGYAGKSAGDTHVLADGVLGLTVWGPYPVVGVIVSWTSPFASTFRRAAAALAGGSTVVVKPPEQAPFAVLRGAEIMTQAGLPPGVLNVVTGFGAQAGEALAMSPGVSLLAFSGSIETARRVMLSSAKSNLKPTVLDLGGKGAHIVFPDADLRRAVGAVARFIFSSRGRASHAGSRLLVHESLYESLATTVAQRARETVVGDPFDEHTELGPLISEEHMKRVLAYVELGRREGAKVVSGGKREVDGPRSEGFFVQPTVLVDVQREMRVAREEITGPVLSIIPFRTEDEAVEIANDTDYGLASAVWTEDGGRAQRVAHRLEAGVVWVNDYGLADPALPFGGVDLSGGGREGGRMGLQQFSRTKTIYLPSR